MFWIIFFIIVAAGLTLLIISLTEPHRPEFTVYNMTGSSSPDLRILFFADLHAETCYVKPGYITGLIESQKPDMVIFGGDIITDPEHADKGIRYLREISSRCRELNIPFYGVTGNHDHLLSDETVSGSGFELIENRYITCGRYVISGLDDSGRDNRQWYEPVDVPSGLTHILIAHDPDAILHVSDPDRIRYVLSGHIHGGQIRTPFKIEFNVLRKDELPRMGIYKGVHMIGSTKVFISRGIGCSILPMRLGARPEVSVIEF